VKVLRSAPLGDPIAIGIRSYTLALRRADAARVEVEQVEVEQVG
jgi:Fe2+ transport system protein FeoA